MAVAEWQEGSAWRSAALHTIPSRVAGGHQPDQWWSLGVISRARETDLSLLSGPCAINGQRSFVKTFAHGGMEYPDNWLELCPGDIVEKTFCLQACPAVERGSGFRPPMHAALALHAPFSLAGLPTFDRIVRDKYRFACSRFRDREKDPGFEMYPNADPKRPRYVMGWCGQAEAAGASLLQLARRLGDPNALEMARRSLNFLATAPVDAHGFPVNYDAGTGKWDGRNHGSMGQAMENLARGVRIGRALKIDDVRGWEAFLRKACEVHAARILENRWQPMTKRGWKVNAMLIKICSVLIAAAFCTTAVASDKLGEVEKAVPAKALIGAPARAADLPGELLAAYAKGVRDITIAPGTYVLPTSGKTTIELASWNAVSIHAQGVTIVFQELAYRPILLKNCRDVSLDGPILRFAVPAFTQGRIKEMGKDKQGMWLDWQIDVGYAADIDPTKASLDVVDQATRLLKTGTGDFGCVSYETLGAGLYRLHGLRGGIGPASVGDWVFTRHKGGSSIVQLDGCERCTMRKVILQNSGFAAFFETGGIGGNLYEDCRVMHGPRPAGAAEDQLVGCGADGFHSTGTKNGPTILRCSWEGLLHDDCIAIHGSLQKVIRAKGNKLVLEPGNRGGFACGEPVRISSANGYFGEFTCTKVEEIASKIEFQEVTLHIVVDREGSGTQENLRRLPAIEPIKISGANNASRDFTCWSVAPAGDNEYVLAVTPAVTAGTRQGIPLEIHPNDLLKISGKRGLVGNFLCKEHRSTTRNQRFLEVALDRESGAPAGAKASNPRHNGAGFKILNCRLGNCRSRAILVKADNGLIEGCTISGCGMSAISIGPEYWWGEADYSKNVTVRRNRLSNNVLNGSAAGVVFVHGDGAIGNGSIAITDNFFDRNYGQIAVHVEDTDGVSIASNRFIVSPLPLPGRARTVLEFKTTRNITLRDNRVESFAANDTLVHLGKDVEVVSGNGPTGIVSTPSGEPLNQNSGK